MIKYVTFRHWNYKKQESCGTHYRTQPENTGNPKAQHPDPWAYYMLLLLVTLYGILFSSPTAFSRDFSMKFSRNYSRDIESIIKNSSLSYSYKKAIMDELKNAVDDGITGSLLAPRIREDIAKGVEGKKILEVLRNEIWFLKKARKILLSVQGGKKLLKDEASWARTANLLATGISEDEIKTIVKTCQKRLRDYRGATYLYVSLTRWKLSREKSLILIEELLKSSIKSEDFTGITGILVEGRRQKIHSDELADRMIVTLPDIRNIDELREKVLYQEP